MKSLPLTNGRALQGIELLTAKYHWTLKEETEIFHIPESFKTTPTMNHALNNITDLKNQYTEGLERYFTLLEVLKIYPSEKIQLMLKETSANNRILDRIISNHTTVKEKAA